MLEDKSEIADIATKVRRFAKGRKSEISATKYLLFGHFPVLGGILSATAAIMDTPVMHLGWIPHALMTFYISGAGDEFLAKALRSAVSAYFQI